MRRVSSPDRSTQPPVEPAVYLPGPIGHSPQPADNSPIVIGFGGPPPSDLLTQHSSIIHSMMRRYAQYTWHGMLDAQDIEQEAIIGLYKAHQTFDPSAGSPFTAYARRVIENNIRNAIRNAQPYGTRESTKSDVRLVITHESFEELRHELDFVADFNVEQRVTDSLDLMSIIDAFHRLGSRNRRILYLRLILERPLREIANREGISHTRVKQLVSDALIQVRHYLSDKDVSLSFEPASTPKSDSEYSMPSAS